MLDRRRVCRGCHRRQARAHRTAVGRRPRLPRPAHSVGGVGISSRRRGADKQIGIADFHFSIYETRHDGEPQKANELLCAARRGAAILEMLIVLTVAAVILGTAVSAIHLLLAAEREAARSTHYSASLARLARVFRDDLHMVARAELSAADLLKPAILTLSLADGGRIRYELDQHWAKRVEIDPSGKSQRDDFYFAPRSRLRFDRVDKGLVRLEIEMPINSGQPQRNAGSDACRRRRCGVRSSRPLSCGGTGYRRLRARPVQSAAGPHHEAYPGQAAVAPHCLAARSVRDRRPGLSARGRNDLGVALENDPAPRSAVEFRAETAPGRLAGRFGARSGREPSGTRTRLSRRNLENRTGATGWPRQP